MAKNSSSAGIISGATANTGVTSSSAGSITGTVSSSGVSAPATSTTAVGAGTSSTLGTTTDGVGIMASDNGGFVDEHGNTVEYSEIERNTERRTIEGVNGELIGISVEASPEDYVIPSHLDREPEYDKNEEDKKELSSEELAKAEDEARKEIADLNAKSPEGVRVDKVNR